MCSTCGCGGDDHGQSETEIAPPPHPPHTHGHDHDDAHDPPADPGAAGRRVRVEQELLAKNDRYAAANRQSWEARSILALNLLSSPGSGKTALLVATSRALAHDVKVAVVEGDQQTSLDADRIRATGVAAMQINTGKGCHLDAHQVGHAVESLALADRSLLFIENVGNLVCPAEYDLGEHDKVMLLSVTDGADKPSKYPVMFHEADVLLITKIDLLPYVDFDLARAEHDARALNGDLQIFRCSARTGEGIEAWLQWLQKTAQRNQYST